MTSGHQRTEAESCVLASVHTRDKKPSPFGFVLIGLSFGTGAEYQKQTGSKALTALVYLYHNTLRIRWTLGFYYYKIASFHFHCNAMII